MHADEIRAALKSDPFRPFRMRLASGRIVEVVNPELVVVSSTGRTAFAYRPGSDAFDVVGVRMVESLEFGSPAAKRRRSA